MATYYGCVIGGRIQLDPPVSFPEGTRVTIMIAHSQASTDAETALDQELAAEGLVSLPCTSQSEADFLAYQPVAVEGGPLSKSIVEERR